MIVSAVMHPLPCKPHDDEYCQRKEGSIQGIQRNWSGEAHKSGHVSYVRTTGMAGYLIPRMGSVNVKPCETCRTMPLVAHGAQWHIDRIPL